MTQIDLSPFHLCAVWVDSCVFLVMVTHALIILGRGDQGRTRAEGRMCAVGVRGQSTHVPWPPPLGYAFAPGGRGQGRVMEW